MKYDPNIDVCGADGGSGLTDNPVRVVHTHSRLAPLALDPARLRERVEALERFSWDLSREGGAISDTEVVAFLALASEVLSYGLQTGDLELQHRAVDAWSFGIRQANYWQESEKVDK